MFKKIFKFLWRHKIISGIIIIIAAVAGYFEYSNLNKNTASSTYVLAAVQKGTIITTVSGTGQVSASDQVDIKPKASGDVVYVGVKNGQTVKAGTLLVQLDDATAQKSVRDAENSLASSQLSLQKLQEPVDALSLLQAENSLLSAQQSKTQADSDFEKSYEDGFNSVANTFIDLPTIMSGLKSILFDSSISPNQQNIDWYSNQIISWEHDKSLSYKSDAYNAYVAARQKYDTNFSDYKAASRSSDKASIEALISETYDTSKSIADAIKSTNDYISFAYDVMTQHSIAVNSVVLTHQSSLNNYTGKINTHLSDLLSATTTIDNAKNSVQSANGSVQEKTESLAKLKTGADPLDIQSQELQITQKQNALLDAKQNLDNYYIRAPFDGVIAAVDVNKGDSASSGTAVATLITQQKIAGISLNEVDMANVKVGQKATLTFDAVSGLSIAGQVLDIDTIGTVSQGVVTYNVKVGFDTQDDRVKPGMSVSVAVITDAHQNVLVVPNSAIKTQGGLSYVQIPDENVQVDSNSFSSSGVSLIKPPRQQPVEVGLANDTDTEITSGLNEGDIVVVRTISSATKTAAAASSQTSLFPSAGGTNRVIRSTGTAAPRGD